jgi:hypothetical protein
MPPQVGLDPGGAEGPDSYLTTDDPPTLDIRHFTAVGQVESAPVVWAHAGRRSPARPHPTSLVAPAATSCPYLYLDGTDGGSDATAARSRTDDAGAAGARGESNRPGDSSLPAGASCLALSEAVPIGRRQLALVCAGPGHVGCPRFAHGGVGERPVPAARLRSALGMGSTTSSGPAQVSTAIAVAEGSMRADLSAAADPPAIGTTAAVPADPDFSAADLVIDAEASRSSASSAEVSLAANTAVVGETPVPAEQLERIEPVPAERERAEPERVEPERVEPEQAEPERVEPERIEPEPISRPGTAPRPAEPAIARRSADRSRAAPVRRVPSQAHRRSIGVRPATLVSIGLLIGAFVLALAFVAGRGGLTVPGLGTATTSLEAAATESAIPTATHEASPSTSPSVPPSPSPRRTPRPTATPTPGDSSSPTIAPDVLALLEPCADAPDCYQYRVRSGDNLHKIADLFGIPYRTVLSLNPEITNPSIIHVGQLIKLPPPVGA